ncbi:MAG: hypothetical protein ICV83_27405, partial [Cytophagales bacterium]|nr:hypothetical protein [Cytophagales bacterium]
MIPLLQPGGDATARKARRKDQPVEEQRSKGPGEPSPQLPRCVVAGEGSLLLYCIRVLTAKGLSLAGVVSADPQVQAFALAGGIAVYPSPDDLPAVLPGAPVDYLFSIGSHPAMDPASLEHLQRGVVRYYDGPLPGRESLPAPCEAILEGEKEYCITWHLSSPRGETGKLLLQKPVDIAPDETALTLHAKCYEAAQAGFTDLVEALRTGTYLSLRPLGDVRPYLPSPARPAHGSIFSWHQPAETMSRLCRALDFGPYANPVSLPKLLDAGELLVPVGLRPLDAPSRLAPGTIVEMGETGIRIATATHDVFFSHVTTLEGASLSPTRLHATRGWQPGYRLPQAPADYVAAVETREAAVVPHQAYWAAKLEKTQPTALPFAARLPLHHDRTAPLAVVQPWPLDPTQAPPPAGEADLCAALAAYLHRATGTPGLCIGFAEGIPARPSAAEPAFFAPLVPLHVYLEATAPFAALRQAVSRELEIVRAHQTYCRDL